MKQNTLHLGYLFAILISSISPCLSAEKSAIGKITELKQKEFYPIEILENGSLKRGACLQCPLYENDVIVTHRSQHISIALNDGSELAIGPDSHVTIDNWSQRNSSGFLKRMVIITNGALRATIKRVYSEDEPFLVKAKQGVMAVRGTQFIAFLEKDRVNKFNFETTVNLYTLEGEVHFARTENDLTNGDFIITLANHRSILYENAKTPTAPRKFEAPELRSILQKAIPQAASQVILQKYSYQAKEESIRSVISPQRTTAVPAETPPSVYPQRAPHTNGQKHPNTNSVSAALARAEAAKAHRKALENNELIATDDEVMAQKREEQRRKVEAENSQETKPEKSTVRSGYGPGPNGLNTFRSSNPTSPARLQQGLPRPQTAPELRR